MRQTFIGMVISTAAQKTVKVSVPRLKMHKLIQKEIVRHRNFAVHDEKETCGLGDVVRIEACRPISKTKHFCVAEIVKKADTYVDPDTGKVFR